MRRSWREMRQLVPSRAIHESRVAAPARPTVLPSAADARRQVRMRSRRPGAAPSSAGGRDAEAVPSWAAPMHVAARSAPPHSHGDGPSFVHLDGEFSPPAPPPEPAVPAAPRARNADEEKILRKLASFERIWAMVAKDVTVPLPAFVRHCADPNTPDGSVCDDELADVLVRTLTVPGRAEQEEGAQWKFEDGGSTKSSFRHAPELLHNLSREVDEIEGTRMPLVFSGYLSLVLQQLLGLLIRLRSVEAGNRSLHVYVRFRFRHTVPTDTFPGDARGIMMRRLHNTRNWVTLNEWVRASATRTLCEQEREGRQVRDAMKDVDRALRGHLLPSDAPLSKLAASAMTRLCMRKEDPVKLFHWFRMLQKPVSVNMYEFAQLTYLISKLPQTPSYGQPIVGGPRTAIEFFEHARERALEVNGTRILADPSSPGLRRRIQTAPPDRPVGNPEGMPLLGGSFEPYLQVPHRLTRDLYTTAHRIAVEYELGLSVLSKLSETERQDTGFVGTKSTVLRLEALSRAGRHEDFDATLQAWVDLGLKVGDGGCRMVAARAFNALRRVEELHAKGQVADAAETAARALPGLCEDGAKLGVGPEKFWIASVLRPCLADLSYLAFYAGMPSYAGLFFDVVAYSSLRTTPCPALRNHTLAVLAYGGRWADAERLVFKWIVSHRDRSKQALADAITEVSEVLGLLLLSHVHPKSLPDAGHPRCKRVLELLLQVRLSGFPLPAAAVRGALTVLCGTVALSRKPSIAVGEYGDALCLKHRTNSGMEQWRVEAAERVLGAEAAGRITILPQADDTFRPPPGGVQRSVPVMTFLEECVGAFKSLSLALHNSDLAALLVALVGSGTPIERVLLVLRPVFDTLTVEQVEFADAVVEAAEQNSEGTADTLYGLLQSRWAAAMPEPVMPPPPIRRANVFRPKPDPVPLSDEALEAEETLLRQALAALKAVGSKAATAAGAAEAADVGSAAEDGAQAEGQQR
eukprot:TRINITY_DN25954_c0_g1_i1.p1 TRINITY_DN25954_c0_g1~~TRINITY_DN25954_c0_g1_i1.p1  ORF type:complete len:976 (+),score=253.57 TRINITY_DN25954_c0_g1_i1:85-3012(+)